MEEHIEVGIFWHPWSARCPFAWSWRMSSGADQNCSQVFQVDVDGALDTQLRVECVKQESPGTLEPTTRSEGAPNSRSGACAYAELFVEQDFETLLFSCFSQVWPPGEGFEALKLFMFQVRWYVFEIPNPRFRYKEVWNLLALLGQAHRRFGLFVSLHGFHTWKSALSKISGATLDTLCISATARPVAAVEGLHLQHLAGVKKNPSGCTWKSLKKDTTYRHYAAKAPDWCSKFLGLCCSKDNIVMWSVKAW